jgi:hypothetical protein
MDYRTYGHRRYFNNGDCYKRIRRVYKGRTFVTFRKLNKWPERWFVPDLIPCDLVGIMPMTGPVGQIFAMRTNYGVDAETQIVGTSETSSTD